jgi:hypothetical protein
MIKEILHTNNDKEKKRIHMDTTYNCGTQSKDQT